MLYEIMSGRPVFGLNLQAQQIMRRVLDGERPDIPDDVPAFVESLIRSGWSKDPAARFSFSELFTILEENDFKICESVDSSRVRSFIKSIEQDIS
jgi:hypothetical protein